MRYGPLLFTPISTMNPQLSIEQEEQVYKENVNYMLDSPWREPIESWLREPKNRFEYVTADLL